MLYTVIKENSYQDSINLMLLTSDISDIAGVAKVQVMMGTEANKDIFKQTGLLTPEAKAANPSDMMIVMDAESDQVRDEVLAKIEVFLSDLSVSGAKNEQTVARNWEEAVNILPEANLALISVPGTYAAMEIERALDRDLHAFVFSDNVPIEEELRLKQKAHEKGLLVMGPDCGTGIISGVPLAFTNSVVAGPISIVGASGTGIQEVTTLIEKNGSGVTHAIGTGGRDLSSEVGAITMKDAIQALAFHAPTKVITIISKPPAPAVRDEVMALLASINKPVVAIFLGERPTQHLNGVYLAHTLEEAAKLSVDLAQGRAIPERYAEKEFDVTVTDKKIVGLYSGGTLAYEAGMLISEALELTDHSKEAGYVLRSQGFEVLDLGDDRYTQGRPHPMIDPEIRIQKIKEYAHDPAVGVILLDDVLGYGTHEDMANALVPTIMEAQAIALTENRELAFVATVVGTDHDPQQLGTQQVILEKAGIKVLPSNAQAVKYALALIGKQVTEPVKEMTQTKINRQTLTQPSAALQKLLTTKPAVINVGIRSFYDAILSHGGQAVQYDWKPIAGGKPELIKALLKVQAYEKRQAENQTVIDRIKAGAPFLVDVKLAKEVIPEINGHVLLHAGPPMGYHDMTDPMQGSCVGAVLFEGWAQDEAEARRMLEAGEITFIPCHHVNAVGPMGGITSANMAVLVVENRLDGNRAFCTMNEGIGKVLRFGAYSQEVIDRLAWMRDRLAPVLSQALQRIEGGLNVNVILAKAITMGDEFHQRNIAASLIFLKEMAPLITTLPIDDDWKQEVVQFLADTDQFFLNIMMASGKAIVDAARKIESGSIVTTMTRNGKDFGIRVSGLGETWFTAPVNTPKGLFFTGYSQEDANPDMGDSAIAETIGFGGMAMIAAPGVTRFVGAGGFQDAQKISDEMAEICVTRNANFSVPTWDFQGTVLGIDICKVVETGITPVINTGIAGKVAGVGQVGAGTVNAPLACFEKALLAYAEQIDHMEEGVK